MSDSHEVSSIGFAHTLTAGNGMRKIKTKRSKIIKYIYRSLLFVVNGSKPSYGNGVFSGPLTTPEGAGVMCRHTGPPSANGVINLSSSLVAPLFCETSPGEQKKETKKKKRKIPREGGQGDGPSGVVCPIEPTTETREEKVWPETA